MNDRRNNRSIVLFITLALGLSLAYWGLFYLHDSGLLPFDPASDAMGALRGYGPTLAALIAALVIYGRDGVSALWRRVTQWRVPGYLLALAILGPLLGSVILVLLCGLAGADLTLTQQMTPIPKLIIIFFFFAIVDGPIGEEIGWRGFLLPRLLSRHGPLGASLLLGLVWFAWHIPLYLATGRVEMTVAFLAGYALNNVAFSFLHTWFFLRSKGSALLAIVLHTSGNYAVYLAVTLFPGLEQAPFTQHFYVGLLVVAAVFAGLSMRNRGPGMTGGSEVQDARNA